MLRLIALYLHYRDLQEERARGGARVALPVMRAVPTSYANSDEQRPVRALAA